MLEPGIPWGGVCAHRNLLVGLQELPITWSAVRLSPHGIQFRIPVGVPLVVCSSKETAMPRAEDITVILHELLLLHSQCLRKGVTTTSPRESLSRFRWPFVAVRHQRGRMGPVLDSNVGGS